MKAFFSFDVSAFDWFVNDAGQHYERTSPTVETWLDQVCDRVRDGSITLAELRRVAFLYQDSLWLDPNGAANVAYKAMSEFGSLPANVTLSF
jgi:hypothetical protein